MLLILSSWYNNNKLRKAGVYINRKSHESNKDEDNNENSLRKNVNGSLVNVRQQEFVIVSQKRRHYATYLPVILHFLLIHLKNAKFSSIDTGTTSAFVGVDLTWNSSTV